MNWVGPSHFSTVMFFFPSGDGPHLLPGVGRPFDCERRSAGLSGFAEGRQGTGSWMGSDARGAGGWNQVGLHYAVVLLVHWYLKARC